ncbi:MAG: L,D-transpeptidase family protein [Acidithiobacillus sp.]|uniref:L,D-transpeptidase family protein n=1 Tax=Acidithiobacillus sp. TaxID=1872118 RepID=UPI0025BFE96F|nr:L,D-transpeptidase family protein [Acidithiobacillus sp.]
MNIVTRIALSLACLCSAASVTAAEFPLPPPPDNVIGSLAYTEARYEDTLIDIARRHDIGYDQMRLANPKVDPWLPGAGTQVLIPGETVLPDAPRQGIVINLAAMRLFYYPQGGKGATVVSYPLGIGREGWRTPLGQTRVTSKVKDPTWTPPASIRAEHAQNGDMLPDVVPAGPDNPLGQYALRLGWPGYLIHGTDKPWGVGMRVSHGCIRLYPEDIAKLYAAVPAGTTVTVVNQPWLWGRRGDHLYLQVNPVLDDDSSPAEIEARFMIWLKESAPKGVQIAPARALEILHRAEGVPVLVAILPPAE